MNEKLMGILDNYAKHAFDEGMKCVKDNIDPKTGLWKMAKKFVDMTEQRKQAHDQIIKLFRECLPKKEPLRLPIHLKDKLIELLHKFKGLCCASMMGEYTHMTPCLFCRVKDSCGIVTSNAIKDLFSEVYQDIITEAEKKIGG